MKGLTLITQNLKYSVSYYCTLFSNCSSTLNPLGYEKPPTKYSAETILKILLDPEIDRSRICNMWPVAVHSSTTFVVDVTKLKHPDDVRKDFFGRWKHSGSHPTPFKARVSEEGVEVERCALGATGAVYYLRRLHGYHPSNPSFRRLIAFVSGECNCSCIGVFVYV